MKTRKREPCVLCGGLTRSADGICSECSDGTICSSTDSGTPLQPFWEDDADEKQAREQTTTERYHGDVYRDDI